MTRRAPLQALALLVATLACPAPALADPDQGRDQRHGEKHSNGRSDEQYQSGNGNRGNGRNAQQRQSLSPQGAAQQARSQYGGQVLKVQPTGRGYQVRLLKDDGRVVTVPIGD